MEQAKWRQKTDKQNGIRTWEGAVIARASVVAVQPLGTICASRTKHQNEHGLKFVKRTGLLVHNAPRNRTTERRTHAELTQHRQKKPKLNHSPMDVGATAASAADHAHSCTQTLTRTTIQNPQPKNQQHNNTNDMWRGTMLCDHQ